MRRKESAQVPINAVTGQVPRSTHDVHQNMGDCEFSPVRVYSVHVPARRPRTPLYSRHAFARINVCRNAIAQAERSGGYRLASLRRPFLHITGSTVTTEPKSLFAGKRAAMSPFTCA